MKESSGEIPKSNPTEKSPYEAIRAATDYGRARVSEEAMKNFEKMIDVLNDSIYGIPGLKEAGYGVEIVDYSTHFGKPVLSLNVSHGDKAVNVKGHIEPTEDTERTNLEAENLKGRMRGFIAAAEFLKE